MQRRSSSSRTIRRRASPCTRSSTSRARRMPRCSARIATLAQRRWAGSSRSLGAGRRPGLDAARGWASRCSSAASMPTTNLALLEAAGLTVEAHEIVDAPRTRTRGRRPVPVGPRPATHEPQSPRPPVPSRPDRADRSASSPVKIQEADAKSLLLAQGLPVPAWEVAHTVDEARAAAATLPRRRPGRRQGRHQGPGARRRARQGRRRQARRLGRRGGDGRRRDPRDGHQGHDRPQGAGRGRRPTSSRSSTWRPCSTAPSGGSC